MSVPVSCRNVHLIDGQSETRPLVIAQLYRDYPIAALEEVEARWAQSREQAALEGSAPGLAPIEHAHWDWRNKADSVEAGEHMLVGIECNGDPQGIMAVLRLPRPSWLADGQIVYVDYVESAPWNLKAQSARPRFIGVGTVLIAEAVQISLESGLGGAIGLHSLPQAEAFYAKCGMTRCGVDPHYFDLSYYEFTRSTATSWLSMIGGNR